MTELDLIIDLHKGTLRQGPGSEKETLKAFELTGLPFDKELSVADIGCGTGASITALATVTQAQFVGIDLFPSFLNALEQNAQNLKLGDRIQTLQKSMEDLSFEENSLDLIWSEGAIYNMGFEKGIREWRTFVKPGGYLAVSEITWITPTRPQEIEDYWQG